MFLSYLDKYFNSFFYGCTRFQANFRLINFLICMLVSVEVPVLHCIILFSNTVRVLRGGVLYWARQIVISQFLHSLFLIVFYTEWNIAYTLACSQLNCARLNLFLLIVFSSWFQEYEMSSDGSTPEDDFQEEMSFF